MYWIKNTDFKADLDGFVPELQDWIDARCDKRTDLEKAMEEKIKHKTIAQFTPAEQLLLKKSAKRVDCESDLAADLIVEAWNKVFKASSVTSAQNLCPLQN
jgi:hypothetical protein